jgi:hypothetical protein
MWGAVTDSDLHYLLTQLRADLRDISAAIASLEPLARMLARRQEEKGENGKRPVASEKSHEQSRVGAPAALGNPGRILRGPNREAESKTFSCSEQADQFEERGA